MSLEKAILALAESNNAIAKSNMAMTAAMLGGVKTEIKVEVEKPKKKALVEAAEIEEEAAEVVEKPKKKKKLKKKKVKVEPIEEDEDGVSYREVKAATKAFIEDFGREALMAVLHGFGADVTSARHLEEEQYEEYIEALEACANDEDDE